MPHVNGPELLARLAEDDRFRSIPAIAVSAAFRPPLPSNALVFLAKPFKLERLLEAVRDCLACTGATSAKAPRDPIDS